MEKKLFKNKWALPLFIGDAITGACKLFFKHKVSTASTKAAQSTGIIGKIPLVGKALKGVVSVTAKAVSSAFYGIFGLIGKLFPVFLALTAIMLILWLISRMKKAKSPKDSYTDPDCDTDEMNSF